MASGRLRLHRQAAQRGQDLHAVDLALAVRVFFELGIEGPEPGVLDAPAVSPVLQHGCGRAPETRDVVMGFVDALAIDPACAAHRQDRGAARPILHHTLWGGYAAQCLGEVTTTFAFAVTGLPWRFAAIGQSIPDPLRYFTATVFHRVPLRGRLASAASRRHALRGTGKWPFCMQRMRLHQQPTELHQIEQLA